MTEIYMRKAGGCLVPADEAAVEALHRFSAGDPVKVSVKRPRNYEFFKKWWVLVNYCYEFWEPAPLPAEPGHRWMKRVTPEKNFEQFRKDVTILAGFYDAHYRLDGSVRIEAKSISFGSMSEDEFEQLYSKAIDVLLKHVFSHTDTTAERLREICDELLRFAA